jgi:hypothetical protein
MYRHFYCNCIRHESARSRPALRRCSGRCTSMPSMVGPSTMWQVAQLQRPPQSPSSHPLQTESSQGRVPASLDGLVEAGANVQHVSIVSTPFGPDDVEFVVSNPGVGFGDPLERSECRGKRRLCPTAGRGSMAWWSSLTGTQTVPRRTARGVNSHGTEALQPPPPSAHASVRQVRPCSPRSTTRVAQCGRE